MAKCGRESLLNGMSPLELKNFLLSLDGIKVVYNCCFIIGAVRYSNG